jgi:hypothetical protein
MNTLRHFKYAVSQILSFTLRSSPFLLIQDRLTNNMAKPKGGAQPGAGNPGYGKMELIRSNFDKFSPVFWQLMERFSQSKSKDDQRFFLQEFNKIQTKMIPQAISDPSGGPIVIQWLSASPIIPGDGQNVSTTHPHAG